MQLHKQKHIGSVNKTYVFISLYLLNNIDFSQSPPNAVIHPYPLPMNKPLSITILPLLPLSGLRFVPLFSSCISFPVTLLPSYCFTTFPSTSLTNRYVPLITLPSTLTVCNLYAETSFCCAVPELSFTVQT